MSEDFREIIDDTEDVIVEDAVIDEDDENDDDYEQVCMMCHRPESKAGKILTLPGGLNICSDCMQRMFSSMEQYGMPEIPGMGGAPSFMGKFEIPVQQGNNSERQSASGQRCREEWKSARNPPR